MNKKHMLKMMNLLKKPQPKTHEFNQRFWKREEKGDKSKKSCGCIVATLLLNPYFKKLGLEFFEGYSDWKKNETGKGSHRELGVVYKKQHGIGALTELFDLNMKESAYIFGSQIKKENTKTAALKRIQQVYDGKMKFSKSSKVSDYLIS